MIQSVLVILVVALIGGFLPLRLRRSERQLHTALALSTGIFLGAVFLHLLPTLAAFSAGLNETRVEAEAAAADPSQVGSARPASEESAHADEHAEHAEHDEQADSERAAAALAGFEELHHQTGHSHRNSWIWFWVLIGVLGVYVFESLLLRTHDHGDLHRHRSVGYASLLGISIHALTTGFSLGAVGNNAELQGVILLAVLGHKGFEAFSLTTVFQLAEFSRKAIVWLVIAFALVTPTGMLIGDAVASGLGATGLGVVTALAAGTFLFVCLSELLPEIFHHREDSVRKLLLLGAGVGLMVVFEKAGA